jgi:hypothetical protein
MRTTKRDFLNLTDLSGAEAREVLALATMLKREPKGTRMQLLPGRAVAIVLEKASTRTRVSFEVGCAQLGMHPVVLNVQGSQLGRGEPIRDTARVLARYCDAIVFRTSERTAARRDGYGQRSCHQCTVQRGPSRPGPLRHFHHRGASGLRRRHSRGVRGRLRMQHGAIVARGRAAVRLRPGSRGAARIRSSG